MGSSAGHGPNGHAADQINKLKSKALAQSILGLTDLSVKLGAKVMKHEAIT